MSPHIVIDEALDGLESPNSPELNEVLEGLIIRFFTAGEITELRDFIDQMDALRDKTRAPLNEWQAAEDTAAQHYE